MMRRDAQSIATRGDKAAQGPDPIGVAELYEQAIRVIYSEAFAAGLNPAQWNALRYLSSALPERRTPSAFAQYHHVTRGTASQTINALERKRLVTKRPDETDGRAVRLELTEAGHAMLTKDPLNLLADAFAQLPRNRLEAAMVIGQQVTMEVYRRVSRR